MTLKSLAVKTGIATVAITAMGLVAAAPASAHTNNMYTYVYYNDQNQQAYFANYGKADGVATALPTSFVAEEAIVYGIEVANEKGTAIGWDGDDYVRTWDHTTGARGAEVLVSLTAGEFDEFRGLDTLNDGTTVTLVRYITEEGPVEFPVDVPHWVIASVNAATGELHPAHGVHRRDLGRW